MSYRTINNPEWKQATILSRAGKVSGIYRDYLNIKDDNELEGKCIDWKEVEDWQRLPDETLHCTDDDIFDAKVKELNNWTENKVYTSVKDEGQKCVSCRWVINEKENENGSTFVKARLVARGFEEDPSNIQTDSPTCGKEALRVVFSIAASEKWTCHTLDVKAAFLQGSPLQRKVYLRPPLEANAGKHIWLLNTCVYGLNDASRYWYLRVREELFKLGMKASKFDGAIFYFHNNNILEGIICTHVDDFFYCGTNNFKSSIIDKLRNIFKFGSEQSNMFKYIGLNIKRLNNGKIIVHQNTQIEEIIEPMINKEKHPKDNLNEKEIKSLRSICGQLNWIATQTRPDLSFDVCELSCSIKDAKICDLKNAVKTIRKAKSERVLISFPTLDIKNSTIIIYSDASYGNLPDGSSQGGYIIFICDKEGVCAPLFWSSTKIRRIARSTLAAECMSLQEGADTGILIGSLYSELLNLKTPLKVSARTDSKGLHTAVYSTKAVSDRRLRIDVANIRQMLERNELSTVCWTDKNMQLADCLTKKTASREQLLKALNECKI